MNELKDIINFLQNYYKENNNSFLGTKDHLKKLLLNKSIITQYYRSIFQINGTDILVHLSDTRKGFSGCVTGLKNIVNYNDKMFLNINLSKTSFDIMIINLSFVIKISNTSTGISLDKIKGTIVFSNLLKEYNGYKNTLDNLYILYNFHKINVQEGKTTKMLENIVNGTGNIIGRYVEPHYLDNKDIQSIIDTHTNINKDILDIEKVVINNYIKGKENLILQAFNDTYGAKDKGTIIEEIIVGENTKNHFADMILETDNSRYYINIKASDFSRGNNSSPAGFNVNKLISTYKDTINKRFIFLFLFIDKTIDGELRFHLINFLNEGLVTKYYRLTKGVWEGKHENNRGTIQLTNLTKFLNEKENSINETHSKLFLEKIAQ